uniref:Uncharacterized protein n=1 Tax=Rhizophora mucronata TaxID=61149 RepID=A0A2P2PNL1_RHIMU
MGVSSCFVGSLESSREQRVIKEVEFFFIFNWVETRWDLGLESEMRNGSKAWLFGQ